MKSLKEINIKDGEIVLQPDVVEPKVIDFDPEAYNQAELDRCAEMVKGLLANNWKGIQKSIQDNPECRTSISINLSLNHSTSDSRYAKAKISFAVKTSDEAEICVPNPNQMEMF